MLYQSIPKILVCATGSPTVFVASGRAITGLSTSSNPFEELSICIGSVEVPCVQPADSIGNVSIGDWFVALRAACLHGLSSGAFFDPYFFQLR